MATFKLVDELNAPLISTETPSASLLSFDGKRQARVLDGERFDILVNGS